MAVSPRTFSRLALATFASMVLIVASGAGVRLTGSGLGCPDWPNCSGHHLTASLGQVHAVIEDANRLVTVLLVVLVAVTLLAAILRRPRRSDLVWLGAALVGGVVADAMLGAVVVYTKLNAWLVSGHMALSLGMVVIAGVLHHRSRYRYDDSARHDVRCEWSQPLARLLWALLGVTLLAGMATTGSGPHSGANTNQLVAKRLPFTLQSAAWVHSACALAFIATVLGAYLVLSRTGASRKVVEGAGRLLAVGIAQGMLGVVQYATKLPVVLVELHVLGAVSLTIGVLRFQLLQVARDPDPGVELAAVARREGALAPATPS